MISNKMKPLMKNNSAIRMMFEEGTRLREKYGAENVFDFSIGNPDAPVPKEIKQAMIDMLEDENDGKLHGYMSNAGFEATRDAVAKSLNRRFDTSFSSENIIMTSGAATGLNIALKTILNDDDEVVVFKPYFLEYDWYVKNYGGVVVKAPTDNKTFLPNIEAFKSSISDKTKAVIINSPNNPTGVIYSEDTIKTIANILYDKQKEFGTIIYLIADEPYRELVYSEEEVPYVTKFYNNTIVAYSYSKSLSIPGERIGYIVIPNELEESKLVFDTACAANRIIGCVNAPALQQRIIEKCVDVKVDVDYYNRNREALYGGMKKLGFECIKPDGAFYLFVKSPEPDEKQFCKAAKKFNILMVPGSSFEAPGYVRLAYCVGYDTIMGSMKAFEKLAKQYNI